MKKITLKSQRFDRDKFNETVDTNFTQLAKSLSKNDGSTTLAS